VRTLAGYYLRKGDGAPPSRSIRKLVEMEPTAATPAPLRQLSGARPDARRADAQSAYEKSLELATDETRGEVVQRVASYYYERERYDEAEKTLQAGIEARKDDLDLIYALARFYHSRGDKAKADAMIEQATSARPNEAKPFLILSAYPRPHGDLAGALEAAESDRGRTGDATASCARPSC